MGRGSQGPEGGFPSWGTLRVTRVHCMRGYVSDIQSNQHVDKFFIDKLYRHVLLVVVCATNGGKH